jgi:hypothetical protein
MHDQGPATPRITGPYDLRAKTGSRLSVRVPPPDHYLVTSCWWLVTSKHLKHKTQH